MSRSAFGVSWTRSWPLKTTRPDVISAGGDRSCAMANSSVDLPHPDSPTIPRNSPARTVRSTRSTAPMSASSVRYETERSSTSSSGSGTSLSHRPERGVADLVEGVVHERESGAHDGDGRSGRQRPPRVACLERAALLRVIEHGSPGQLGAVAEAEELQSGRESDDEHGEAEERRNDQRGHGRDDLDEDDVRGAFAAHLRCREKVSGAQREP